MTHRTREDHIPLLVFLVLFCACLFAGGVLSAVDALLWLAGPGLRWTVVALVVLGVLALAGMIP